MGRYSNPDLRREIAALHEATRGSWPGWKRRVHRAVRSAAFMGERHFARPGAARWSRY